MTQQHTPTGVYARSHPYETAIFDIETDGLLEQLTRIHSLCIKIKETGQVISCTDDHPDYFSIEYGLRVLSQADRIVGHNIVKFDIPAIQKVSPSWTYTAEVSDTLLLSQLIYPDMKEKDFARRKSLERKHGKTRMNEMWPGSIIGRHGLDAWGIRLGEWKGDYAKIKAQELKDEFEKIHMAARETGLLARDCPPKKPTKDQLAEYVWFTWNREMQDYCEQDIAVTDALYDRLLSKNYSQEAIDLEHDFAAIIRKMEAEGFHFDVAGGEELERTLMVRLAEIRQELQDAFPPWEVRTPFTPKVNNKTMGYVAGELTYKVKTLEFNPGSRDHIADRLKNKYDWKPTEFTPNDGKPKVDEDVLKALDYPEAELLSEAMMLTKRLGQLSDGNQAWLKLVKPTGKIHHEVATNGAVTGRCTHKRPNVAQTPSAGAPYGKECRMLWGPPKGMKQVGADLSGLELRCLAHFMAIYDDGAYIRELLEGDIHTANQLAAGLPTRDNAKTFIYGFLYGAGPEKIGQIVGKGAAEGKKLIASFLDKTPALKKLRAKIERVASPWRYVKVPYTKRDGSTGFKSKREPNPNYRGYLKGLDGRILPIRSAHAALNTLLQSAGALISKKATVLLYQYLEQRGYRFGVDWALMAHVHDEVQLWSRPEIAEEIGKVCVQAFEDAGEYFKFRCPITGEYKIGDNWYDTH